MLKEELKKSIINNEDVCLMLSGGIDSCILFSMLNENNLKFNTYTLKMDDVSSDDFKSYMQIVNSYNLNPNVININENTDLNKYKDFLIEKGIPKKKKASLLVMSLFCYTIDNIKEKVIYTGLGSDAYYGLGRDFAIKCSLKGEKIPSLLSMNEHRNKTYNHYQEQYSAIKEYAKTKDKIIIAPFLSEEVLNFFKDKTYQDCNKPKKKQILIDLYPEFFKKFKARNPSNMHCGNSNFKKIKNK